MSALIVVGSQWGDEGKGKLVDAMASQSDAVVRFQGGANAGHTLIVNGQKTVLHLIPSGVLHSHVRCMIGSGVTMDPFEMITEINGLKEGGFLKNDEQLSISDGALLVLPFHRQLDKAREAWKSSTKIGTTGRGIGPSYEDRASRRALLFRDLFCPDLKDKLKKAIEEKNILLTQLYGEEPIDLEKSYQELLEVGKTLKPYRCEDLSLQVTKMIENGKRVLFEGAQGVLLDNLHGTFPYVTSSSTGAAAACLGVGVSPRHISKIFGITKAYCTRVGTGPFPTEQENETGALLQKEGHEFGATTGRTRRCGWLDLVALRYAIHVGGIDRLILTKLDVLSNFKTIKVCTQYKVNGVLVDHFSFMSNDIHHVEPVYEELPGWETDISGAQSLSDLPQAARDYVDFIKKQVGVEIPVISVGPDRMQTIYQGEIFDESKAASAQELSSQALS
jgi:adenylosuccinate synthase